MASQRLDADVEAKSNKQEGSGEEKTLEWKPNLHELLIMISLSMISLMVSLDATIIITSLSVRCPQ
jgi:hypothetical protein